MMRMSDPSDIFVSISLLVFRFRRSKIRSRLYAIKGHPTKTNAAIDDRVRQWSKVAACGWPHTHTHTHTHTLTDTPRGPHQTRPIWVSPWFMVRSNDSPRRLQGKNLPFSLSGSHTNPRVLVGLFGLGWVRVWLLKKRATGSRWPFVKESTVVGVAEFISTIKEKKINKETRPCSETKKKR